MNAEFYEALSLLEKEKGIPKEYMYEKIKAAIAATIKRDKQIPADNVDVEFNEEKRKVRAFIKKTVVENVTNPAIELTLDEAKMVKKKYRIGDVVEFDVDPADVGRIAAKVGKNVIVQAINEAVNGSIIQEFERVRGKIVTGKVSRIDEKNKTIYLEVLGYEIPFGEKDLIPGDKFSDGDLVKVCVTEIKRGAKSQEIRISRTSSEFLRSLFEVEVPEIADGTVEIKGISREAGSRSKVAVYSTDSNVDAIGSCIGPKQMRINAILSNICNERIDLIKYSEDIGEFIISSLSPATGRIYEINEEQKSCKVVVPADQLSLAIGKTGQNVRLAARLTGYRIDIVAE